MRLIQAEQIIFHSRISLIFGFRSLLLTVILIALPALISNPLPAML